MAAGGSVAARRRRTARRRRERSGARATRPTAQPSAVTLECTDSPLTRTKKNDDDDDDVVDEDEDEDDEDESEEKARASGSEWKRSVDERRGKEGRERESEREEHLLEIF